MSVSPGKLTALLFYYCSFHISSSLIQNFIRLGENCFIHHKMFGKSDLENIDITTLPRQ